MFRVLTDEESRSVKRWQAPALNHGNRPLTSSSPLNSQGIDLSKESAETAGSDKVEDQYSSSEAERSPLENNAATSDALDSIDGPINVIGPANTSAEMLQSSYDEGYSAGFAAGNAAAYESSNVNMGQLLDQLSHHQILHDEQLFEDIIELVKVTTGLVLHREIQIDAATLKDWVVEGLSRLPTVVDPAVVHMHPLDAASVKQLLAADIKIRIQEDKELRRGDCHIVSGASSLRAGIHDQIDRLTSEIAANPVSGLQSS